MYTGILHTHTLVVILFLLIYLTKTVLLLINKQDSLDKFSKKIKIPEIIVSSLFLITGIYLAYNTGNVGNWLYIKILVVFASIPLAVIAFKKGNKILALFSLLLIIYAYGISETKSPNFKPDIIAENYENMASEEAAKLIFEDQCSNCHGMDGRGVLSGAKDLTESTLPIQEKIEIIKSGKNAMIPYEKKLSAQQIKYIAEYVHKMVVN